MRRLSVSSQRREGELLSRARRAIAVQNQPSALPLLRELAEGGTPPEPLAPAVGDALVATARGAKQDPADRSALARLEMVEERRGTASARPLQTPFSTAHPPPHHPH